MMTLKWLDRVWIVLLCPLNAEFDFGCVRYRLWVPTSFDLPAGPANDIDAAGMNG